MRKRVCVYIYIYTDSIHMHAYARRTIYVCVCVHTDIRKLYAYARICTPMNMYIRICVYIPTYPRARAAHNAPMYSIYTRMYRHTVLPLFTNGNA